MESESKSEIFTGDRHVRTTIIHQVSSTPSISQCATVCDSFVSFILLYVDFTE